MEPKIIEKDYSLTGLKRVMAMIAILFGVVLAVLDGVITNIILPVISTTFKVTESMSIWVVNSYQLSIVVSLFLFSAISATYGYRKIFKIGLVIFTIFSGMCALSETFSMLIIARILQGIGASAIMSVNTSLIRVIYPKNKLGIGMGINATMVAISAVAGPTIASGVLSIASWHWLFTVNVPLGIIGLLIGMKYLPPNPVKFDKITFNWKEGFMNSLMLALFIGSLMGFSHRLDIKILIPMVIATFIVGYVFIKDQYKKPTPLFPVDLLKIPLFKISIIASTCSFFAQMLTLVDLPFYMQNVLGYSDVKTGLMLTAWPAVVMFIAPLSGYLSSKLHPGWLGGIGLFIFSAGLILLAVSTKDLDEFGLIWRMMICGFGFGMFQSPNNSLIMSSSPKERSGSASGMLAMARLTGQTAGAAAAAFFFHLSPEHPYKYALLTAGAFAIFAAVVSFMRLNYKSPLTASSKLMS